MKASVTTLVSASVLILLYGPTSAAAAPRGLRGDLSQAEGLLPCLRSILEPYRRLTVGLKSVSTRLNALPRMIAAVAMFVQSAASKTLLQPVIPSIMPSALPGALFTRSNRRMALWAASIRTAAFMKRTAAVDSVVSPR